jgi:hypothetical protein
VRLQQRQLGTHAHPLSVQLLRHSSAACISSFRQR